MRLRTLMITRKTMTLLLVFACFFTQSFSVKANKPEANLNQLDNVAIKNSKTPGQRGRQLPPFLGNGVTTTERIELGWMNLPPCSRVVWVEGPFGIKYPRYETGEQRLYAYAVINAQNMRQDAIETAKYCALVSIPAAGGIAFILDNPAAAGPAFSSAFFACFGGRFGDIVLDNVTLETQSVCLW